MNDGIIEYRGFWAYVFYVEEDPYYIIDYIEDYGYCWIKTSSRSELEYIFRRSIDDYILGDFRCV